MTFATAALPQIVTGYDQDAEINLVERDGVTKPSLVADTQIQAVFVNLDRSATLFGPYTCISTYPGADFANGRVRFRIPGADTAAITVARCLLEVRRVRPIVAGQPSAEEVPYLAGPFELVRGRL